MPNVLRLTLLVITFMAFTTRPARADDPPIRKPKTAAALDHYARATKLYNVRSFEEAANEYKAGALIEPAPAFDYNLGQCYRMLGPDRYRDAIWHYHRFIKSSPETPTRIEIVQGFITQMQSELAQKAKTQPPTEDASAAIPPATTAPSLSIADTKVAARIEPAPWYTDRLGLAFAGTGLLAVGASGGLFWSASSLDDDANRTPDQRRSEDLHAKADTRSLLGTVIGIGGVGLLITGVIKLAVPGPQTRPTTSGIAVSSSGVMVFGWF